MFHQPIRTQSTALKKSLPCRVLNTLHPFLWLGPHLSSRQQTVCKLPQVPGRPAPVTDRGSFPTEPRAPSAPSGAGTGRGRPLAATAWHGPARPRALPHAPAVFCFLVSRGFRNRIRVFPSPFQVHGRYLLLGFPDCSSRDHAGLTPAGLPLGSLPLTVPTCCFCCDWRGHLWKHQGVFTAKRLVGPEFNILRLIANGKGTCITADLCAFCRGEG